MELRGSYLEVKIHSPKNPIGEFAARGCRIWLTLVATLAWHTSLPPVSGVPDFHKWINFTPLTPPSFLAMSTTLANNQIRNGMDFGQGGSRQKIIGGASTKYGMAARWRFATYLSNYWGGCGPPGPSPTTSLIKAYTIQMKKWALILKRGHFL